MKPLSIAVTILAIAAVALPAPARAALAIPPSPLEGVDARGSAHDHPALIRNCGTPPPTIADREAVRRKLAAELPRLGALRVGGTIPVAVHVIYDGSLGNVSDAAIRDQIDALNRGYSGTG